MPTLLANGDSGHGYRSVGTKSHGTEYLHFTTRRPMYVLDGDGPSFLVLCR